MSFNYMAAETEESSNSALAAMRSHCPVAHSDHFGGHWVTTGYDEVAAVFRDWETFSSTRRDPTISAMNIAPMAIRRLDPEEMDPPEWKDYRQIVGKHLSPGAVQRLQPRIEHWVTHYLNKVVETGRMDVVHDLASPLPGAVTMEWLGFPQEDWEPVSRTYHDLMGYAPGTPRFDATLRDQLWIYGRVSEEIARVRKEPDGGVVSDVVNSPVGGELMPVERAEAVINLMVGGGVETTTSLIASGLLHLGRHPEDRARLLAELELLDIATEEFLRMYPPARSHARTVARDVTFNGCPMKTGDRVLLSEAAANRDPRQFPDPDTFKIDRFPNRHTTFGTGIHRCPGSHLARAEFREVIRQLLPLIPDYRVVEDEVVPYPNWGTMGGWAQVVIEFEPKEKIA